MFEYISKKIADIKILHEEYTGDYFLNRMKPNALFPILFIQNNNKKKKLGTDIIRLLHMCILEKFYRVIFLFSLFDGSIFVTQLVAKHMKEIIIVKFSVNHDVMFEYFESKIYTQDLGSLILMAFAG
jgi:hypothetical protein